ncbi:MAG: hypothetical protein AAGG50_07155 [Bacteroidota bacterium]
MSTPDTVRDRLASGFYHRPDVIARIAEAMRPALLGDGGQPAPARRPARATPPATAARLTRSNTAQGSR